jgi:hypothetical protein
MGWLAKKPVYLFSIFPEKPQKADVSRTLEARDGFYWIAETRRQERQDGFFLETPVLCGGFG